MEDEDAGSAAAHNPGGIALVRQTLEKIKTSQAKRPPSHAVRLQTGFSLGLLGRVVIEEEASSEDSACFTMC